jgi:hypothetical protein
LTTGLSVGQQPALLGPLRRCQPRCSGRCYRGSRLQRRRTPGTRAKPRSGAVAPSCRNQRACCTRLQKTAGLLHRRVTGGCNRFLQPTHIARVSALSSDKPAVGQVCNLPLCNLPLFGRLQTCPTAFRSILLSFLRRGLHGACVVLRGPRLPERHCTLAHHTQDWRPGLLTTAPAGAEAAHWVRCRQ